MGVFFQACGRNERKRSGKDPVIERAYEELNRFSWSEIELNTYEQEEKRERDAQAILKQQQRDLAAQLEAQKAGYIAESRAEGILEGIVKGKAEGELAARKSLALHAMEKGLSLNVIKELTGFSDEELKRLQSENKH
jgi:hypothetical protein